MVDVVMKIKVFIFIIMSIIILGGTNIKNNPFYNMKSLNKLKEILYVEDFTFVNDYNIYIIDENRLVEEPKESLKQVQRRILQLFNKDEYLLSAYIMSKKGYSWIDNGVFHKDSRYFYQLDISKFFPSIERKKVFYFFLHKLKTSPDVANVLADILTINISKHKLPKSVNKWYLNVNCNRKHKMPEKHLSTGTSTSVMFSSLCNLDMFNELYEVALKNGLKMTIYVDDITFSSDTKISPFVRSKINRILDKNKYTINKNKTTLKDKQNDHIVITGVVIKKGTNKVTIKNKLSKSIYDFIKKTSKKECYFYKIKPLLETIKQVSYKDYLKFQEMYKNEVKLL